MTYRFLVGGLGGQGVQLLGKLLTYAGNEEGYYVTFFPSYGGAMRGGVSNCTIVVSDETIGSPDPRSVDCIIALCQEAYEKLKSRLTDNGIIIYEKSLVVSESKNNKTETAVAAVSMAEKTGSDRMSNFVMLGAILNKTEIVSLDTVKKIVRSELHWNGEKAESADRALETGFNFENAEG